MWHRSHEVGHVETSDAALTCAAGVNLASPEPTGAFCGTGLLCDVQAGPLGRGPDCVSGAMPIAPETHRQAQLWRGPRKREPRRSAVRPKVTACTRGRGQLPRNSL